MASLGGQKFLQRSALLILFILGKSHSSGNISSPHSLPSTVHRLGKGQREAGGLCSHPPLVLPHSLGPTYSHVTMGSNWRSCSLHPGKASEYGSIPGQPYYRSPLSSLTLNSGERLTLCDNLWKGAWLGTASSCSSPSALGEPCNAFPLLEGPSGILE